MKCKIKNPRPIGVIGGMGPQASNELYRLMIVKARQDFGARNNDDYPEILIDSVPVPDFLADTKKMEKAAVMLEDRVRRLADFGVVAMTLACNTACILNERLHKQTRVPIISVVEVVSRAVAKQCQRVLIMASPTSLKLKLYQKALTERGVDFVVPARKDYRELEYIIRGVIEEESRKKLMRRLVKLVERYAEDNDIDGIVLGCTELPLVFPENYRIPTFSSLNILAQTLLTTYYYKKE